MTPEQTAELAALKAALKQHIEESEKATPGPWHYWDLISNDVIATGKDKGTLICGLAGLTSKPAEFAFIARARTMSPLACRIALAGIEALEEIDAADKDDEMGAWKDLNDILNLWKGGNP